VIKQGNDINAPTLSLWVGAFFSLLRRYASELVLLLIEATTLLDCYFELQLYILYFIKDEIVIIKFFLFN
jgi:hypothetical protein